MGNILHRVESLNFDLRAISELALNTKGCLRSDLGEVKYPISNKLRNITSKLSKTDHFSYAPTLGHPSLLKAIQLLESNVYNCFEVPSVLVTSGGQAALFAILSSIINSGDVILTDSAYYPPYKNIAQILDAQFVSADLCDLSNVALDQIKVLILNSPHNPTGRFYEIEELEKLSQLAKKHNWIIIEDAVYNHIYFEEPPNSIAQICPERTLVINSVSKNYCMPGMRIGWIIGASNLVLEIAKVHRNMNSCPNSFFQKVLADFLPQSDSFLNNLRLEMKERRDLMIQIFDRLKWKYSIPAGAIYLFVQIPLLKNSIEFVTQLIKEDAVSAMPGTLFGAHQNSIRFCFGSLEKNEIKQLGERLEKYV